MSRLTLDGLTRRFNQVSAVEDVSLDVEPQQVFVVLGPPGSGKSTLARLIVGLIKPDSGDLFLDDRLIQDLEPKARGIGFVAQENTLWPHLTVSENVALALTGAKRTRAQTQSQVEDALSIVGLDGDRNRRIETLDDLYRRRVELARAVVNDPTVLVIDSPAGIVDPSRRRLLHADLKRLFSEREQTTLYLTDDPVEALSVADRLAVLDLGRVVQVGSPIELYESPVDAFVAQLLGAINLFQGQFIGSDTRESVFVRTTIGRLVGRASDRSKPISAGSHVTVAIRPEAIRFGSPLPSDANRLNATVERQVFQGALREVTLRGPGDWPLSAKALHSQARSLREGQSITVAIPPEDVVVLMGRYTHRTTTPS